MAHKGLPSFKRSPRKVNPLPSGEYEIRPPKAAPTPPHLSVLQAIVPIVAALAGSLITYYVVVPRTGVSSGESLLVALLLPSPSYVYSAVYLVSHVVERIQFRRRSKERVAEYRRELSAHESQIRREHEKVVIGLTQTHTPPHDCLGRVERLDEHLWARSPHHPDFLHLRVGVGKLPFTMELKPPGAGADRDPLMEAAIQFAENWRYVDGVPIWLPLRESGVAGVIGPRQAVVNTARALVVQIAAAHSPEEVKIAAIFPEADMNEWDWIRWLPHAWIRPDKRWLATQPADVRSLLTDLDKWLDQRLLLSVEVGRPLDQLPALVLFLGDIDLVPNRRVLDRLVNHGPRVGVFPVFLGDERQLLPKECVRIIEVGVGPGKLFHKVPINDYTPFTADAVSVDLAASFARAMAPIQLNRSGEEGALPRNVPLLDLLQINAMEELNVLHRWDTSRPDGSLAVPIGRLPGGEPLIFDLHEDGDGPHGLVAGTTGSGKTELLQTLIAVLMIHFHPHDLNFILVDFKGGALSGPFRGLPHLVGELSNLDGHMAQRVVVALKAEAERRESMLAAAKVKSHKEYLHLRRTNRGGTALPPFPHLILIVDEFAELKKARDDLIQQLVSTARVGRSLGIHLILATQNPSGIVDPQIDSNTQFRICLRVVHPADSREVLGQIDAAQIAASERGSAYLKVGSNERYCRFQSGYGGETYDPGAAEDADAGHAFLVSLDGRRHVPGQSGEQTGSGPAKPSQLLAVARRIADTAHQHKIHQLEGTWSEPLARTVTLDMLRRERRTTRGWNGLAWQTPEPHLNPVIGKADYLHRQTQEPLTVDIGAAGHIAVYGAPGKGKTTFLQTLLFSLALDHPPSDLHIYALDFGGRALKALEGLPHVGAVVSGDEEERVIRLMRLLHHELAHRKEAFAEAGVSTLAGYRNAAHKALPAIVVALDNLGAFASEYTSLNEMLLPIAREGGNYGIHLALTTGSPSGVWFKLANCVGWSAALQMATADEIREIVGELQLAPAPFPGRGLARDGGAFEFQTALPVTGEVEWERTAAIRKEAAAMTQAWTGAPPPTVDKMPESIPLCDLLVPGADWLPALQGAGLSVPVGLWDQDLSPLAVDLSDHVCTLIAGPSGSGKTSLVESLVLGLAETCPPERLQLFLLDFDGESLGALAGLPQVRGYISSEDAVDKALSEIERLIKVRRSQWAELRRTGRNLRELRRSFLTHQPAVLLVVDGLSVLYDGAGPENLNRLAEIVEQGRNLGVHLILAVDTADLVQYECKDLLIRLAREPRAGFLLGTQDQTDADLFKIRLPPVSDKQPGPGEGFFAAQGRFVKFKAATPHVGVFTLADWVERISKRRGSGE